MVRGQVPLATFLSLFTQLLMDALVQVDSLKILMYQTAFSPSHLAFSGRLADLLVEQGHTVDKIIMVYNPSVSSNGSRQLRNVWRITMPDDQNPFIQMPHITNPFLSSKSVFLRHDKRFDNAQRQLCTSLITNADLIAKLRAEHYDIYVTAAYEGCTYGLYHLVGTIPSMVGYLATPNMDGVLPMLGIAEPPSFVGSTLHASGSGDELDFWERAENFINAVDYSLEPRFKSAQDVFATEISDDFPQLADIGRQMAYIFLNTNEVVDLGRPISAKVKYVGGIAMSEPKPLSQELDSLLARLSSSQPGGVILFSFGSLVKTKCIPRAIKSELFKAFRHFPNHTILWKYDFDERDSEMKADEASWLAQSPNVHLMKWLPQVDLLHDPRVKAFISHMGGNSYLETAHAGVPAVAIPVLGDQFYNAGCAEKLGIAIQLDKSRLTSDTIVAALNAVLDDETQNYTARARKVAEMLRRRPEKTAATFVNYVEYAAAFPTLGPQVLQIVSAGMPDWKYYCLDVVAALIGAGVISLLTIYCVVMYLVKKLHIAIDCIEAWNGKLKVA